MYIVDRPTQLICISATSGTSLSHLRNMSDKNHDGILMFVNKN